MGLYAKEEMENEKLVCSCSVAVWEKGAVIDGATVTEVSPATEDEPLKITIKSALLDQGNEHSFFYDSALGEWRLYSKSQVFSHHGAYSIKWVDPSKIHPFELQTRLLFCE